MDGPRSLVTADHRARIGVPGPAVAVRVREEEVRRLCAAMGETDPRYAPGTGIAPPYAIGSLGGSGMDSSFDALPQRLMTQQEWKLHRQLRVGEGLTATSRLADIRERLGGRYGHSVVVTTGTEYRDAEGSLVAETLVTLVYFDPANMEGGATA